jgi:hypothetical protein
MARLAVAGALCPLPEWGAGVTDSEFMVKLLSDGKPHSTLEIIERSIRTRGCGITPHSRAADLRKRGYQIECEREGEKNGRPVYSYRLLGSLSEGDSETAGGVVFAAVVGRTSCVPSPSESECGSLSERDHVKPETFGGLAATQTPAAPL